MSILKNKKHEAFCRAISLEQSPTDAYMGAYGGKTKQSSARANGTRLMLNAAVKARIAELKVDRDREIAGLVPKIIQRDVQDRAFRICLLQTYLAKIEEVFAARASDPQHFDVPGYKTGIVAVTLKEIGIGEKRTTIKEGAINVGALKELRAHGEQISKECGDWVERHTEEYQDPATWSDSKLDQKIAAKKAEAEREMQAAGVPVEAVN